MGYWAVFKQFEQIFKIGYTVVNLKETKQARYDLMRSLISRNGMRKR